MPSGGLKIQIFRGDEVAPIDNADITVSTVGTPENATQFKAKTDSSGVTNDIELNAPPFENSQEPSGKEPYSLVDLNIESPGFNNVIIKGVQIYPDRTALQRINLQEVARDRVTRQEVVVIPPNVLFGNYPPKIIEEEIKPVPKPSGAVVLPNVVVPQYITVHAGVPDDRSAPNYTVRYKDYIKNVASSEIYATWPESTIRANVYSIISFTLNRVYTEWYRGKGKDFTITNSTAFDQAFNYRRNIYANINEIVDDIFSTYMRRSGQKQPLFSQYCDGNKSQCPGQMTQWGSKYLGTQGRSPYEILTHFYGTNLNLVTAKEVAGIPSSFPGFVLGQGARGQAVRTVQTYLNGISKNYPAIPKVRVDGVYGKTTFDSVKKFQQIFSLPQTGTVNYGTWYALSDVYVAVSKLAELRGFFDTESLTENLKCKTFFPPLLPGVNNLTEVPSVTYFDEN
jgi:hypothetical protein